MISRLSEAAAALAASVPLVLPRRGRADPQSLERYRALIEHATDVIVIVDIDGRIAYISPSSERVFGAVPAEMVGRSLLGVIHDDDVPGAGAALARVVAGPDGATLDLALRARHAGGHWVVVEATLQNRAADPAVNGIVVYARDVSDRMVAEEALHASQEQLLRSQAQLAQAQKLEAIGRLAGGVAHDFNNLLAAIQGAADLLDDELAGGPQREYVEEIRQVTRRGQALTRQLLSIGRQRPGRAPLLDLRALVPAMEGMLRRLLPPGIRFDVRVAADLAAVAADAAQIEQIVLNLVVNARDAIGGAGGIELTVGEESLDGSDGEGFVLPPIAGRFVVLSVRDTGHGMDDATIGQIFEPFFTTKEPGRGTGLGLATVYGIVRESAGQLRVLSEPGRGTRFDVLLPAHAADAAPSPPDPAEARMSAPVSEPGRETRAQPTEPVRGAATILLVDDEAAVRGVTRRLLQRQGYTVLEAEDGKEAVRLAESHDGSIDLLLTDLTMPAMGGRELALRLTHRRPDLCVVFMSGLAAEDVPWEPDQPSFAFLQKPFDQKTLAERVRAALAATGAPRPTRP